MSQGANAATLVTSSLVAAWESSSFDSYNNGDSTGAWPALSNDNAYLWDSGFGGDIPVVDKTNLLNGHAVVYFNGKCALGNGHLGNGVLTSGGSTDYPTGVEFMLVFKQDLDPPDGASLGFNSYVTPCANNGVALVIHKNNGPFGEWHTPFQDGNVYNGMGCAARFNMGNPSTAVSNWCVFRVQTKADGTACNAWINTENFFTSSTYTFSTTSQNIDYGGSCSLLGGYSQSPPGPSSGFGGFKGRIAGIYIWGKVLSASEVTQQKAYILAKWGVSS